MRNANTTTVEAQIERDRMRFYLSLTDAELVKMAQRWEMENQPSGYTTNYRGQVGGRNWAHEALRAKRAKRAAVAA